MLVSSIALLCQLHASCTNSACVSPFERSRYQLGVTWSTLRIAVWQANLQMPDQGWVHCSDVGKARHVGVRVRLASDLFGLRHAPAPLLASGHNPQISSEVSASPPTGGRHDAAPGLIVVVDRRCVVPCNGECGRISRLQQQSMPVMRIYHHNFFIILPLLRLTTPLGRRLMVLQFTRFCQ